MPLTGRETVVARPPLQRLLHAAHATPHSRAALLAPIEHEPALLAIAIELSLGSSPLLLEDWERGVDTGALRVMALFCGQQQRAEHGDAARSLHLEALAHAAANRALAEALPGISPRLAWLTGLLGGIGKHLLLASHGEAYAELIASGASVAREREAFGSDHATLGGELLAGWGAERDIVSALVHQYEEGELLRDAAPLVRLTAVAGRFAAVLMQSADESSAGEARDLAAGLLALDEDAIDSVLVSARRTFEEAVSAYARDGAEPVIDAGERASDPLQHELDLLASSVALRDLLAPIDQVADLERASARLARLLFGLQGASLFEVDHDSGRIKGSAPGPGRAPVSVQMGNVNSVLAESLSVGRALYRRAADLRAVVDRDLLAGIDAAGLACLPLGDAPTPVGLLVAGWEGTEEERARRAPLESIFCRVAGEKLSGLRAPGASASSPRDLIDPERLRKRNREIVHEINNPLAIVQNYLKILSLKLSGDDQVQHNLTVIAEEIQRIGGIVHRFSDVDDESLRPEGPSHLNTIVRDMVEMVRSASPGIEFEVVFGSVQGWDGTHGDRLKQILLNLLKNAAEALEGAGRVRIATRGGVSEAGRSYTELTLADNGPGIPDAIRERLFEPVESRKGAGHQGLGLSIVRRLVEEMGGVISCRSDGGKGTEFRLLLPQEQFED